MISELFLKLDLSHRDKQCKALPYSKELDNDRCSEPAETMPHVVETQISPPPPMSAKCLYSGTKTEVVKWSKIWPHSYILTDSLQFKKSGKWYNNILETRGELFLSGMTARWDKGGRRIVLGDNTDGGGGQATVDPVTVWCRLDFSWTPLNYH